MRKYRVREKLRGTMCTLLTTKGEAFLTRRASSCTRKRGNTLGTTQQPRTPSTSSRFSYHPGTCRSPARVQVLPYIHSRKLVALSARSGVLRPGCQAFPVSEVGLQNCKRWAHGSSSPRRRCGVVASAAAASISGNEEPKEEAGSRSFGLGKIALGCGVVALCFAAGVWAGTSFDGTARLQILLAKVRR